MRTVFLIDGFNLFHSLKKAETQTDVRPIKWLDLPGLCRSYLYLIEREATLESVEYFTAIADHLQQEDLSKPERHRAYTRALTARKVNVHLGRFRKRDVHEVGSREKHRIYEEKETDVAIASMLLKMGALDVLDAAVLMTGDSDLAPAIKVFQELYPEKQLLCAFPFGRKNKILDNLCPRSFTISKEAYAKHQFPERVRLPSGKHVVMPVCWMEV